MCIATAAAGASTYGGIVGGALQIASVAASFVAAQQQAEAQAEYQTRLQIARNEQIRQNQVLAERAYQDNLEAVNARQIQEHSAASQQAQAYQRENAVRRGSAQAATGESGAAGINRDILMSEFDRTETAYNASLNMQQDFRDQSLFFQTRGMQAQAEGRMNSIQPYVPTPVNGPSLFGAAVGIGQGAMYGWDRHHFYNKSGPYADATPSTQAQAYVASTQVSSAAKGATNSLMGGFF